jgi:sn-glycerol 3-phosphate transport system ATP-binding protein
MTVAENIGYSLKVEGRPKAERLARIQAVARIVGLEEFLDRRPAQLSGGQRQRVAMARAMIKEPQVFLFDEPLSNLDAKLRVQMRLEIRRLHRRLGGTSVFVTHDQAEAMALGNRIVVMEAGRIAQSGTPEEVYRAPASRFVGRFLGTLNHLGEDRFCRPEALRLDPAGPVAAVLRAAFFEGGHYRLLLRIQGAEEEIAIESIEPPPAPGSTLRLAIDEATVLRLPA